MHDLQNNDLMREGRRRSRGTVFFFWCASLFFFGAACVGIMYGIFHAQLFRVVSLRVEGLNTVDRDVFLASLMPPLIAEKGWHSFFDNSHILFWKFRSTDNVSSSLPQIKTASFTASLLRREVTLHAEERALFGIWCANNSICYGFDNEGILFVETPETEGALLLKVKDENNRAVFLGGPILPRASWVRTMLSTFSDLEAGKKKVMGLTLRDLKTEEWELDVAGYPPIYLSLNEVPKNLSGVLDGLQKKLSLQKVQYLDMRIPNRIYYK